jgi:hypothetical protein
MSRVVGALTVRFGGSRRFWRLRRRLLGLRLGALGSIFRARHAAVETTTSALALRELLQNTAISLGLACLLVVALALLQGRANELASDLSFGALDPSAYDSLLETVAAATGVFLALYFTAVSAIAASIYVSVPHDIRSLIVGDRLGNLYVRLVAFAMALCVLLLVVHAAAGTTYRLAPPIVGLLAVFSIFAFIRLGRHAFYLADPTHLAETIAERFESQAARARHGSWRWDVPEVQAHFRRVASASLATLSSLLRIATEQEHLRGQSARALFLKTNLLLARYLAGRHRIATKSRWFGERYEHPQWYLADSATLQSAANLAGALTPTTVPDVFWVENEIVPGLIEAIASAVAEDLRSGSPGTGLETLGALSTSWDQFGANWSAEEALRFTRELSDQVLGALCGGSGERRGPIGPALGDALGLVPIALELGFHRTLEPMPIDELDRRLIAADWSASESPYLMRLPRAVIAALEDLGAGVHFEHDSAATEETRTPQWYVREVAFFHYEHEMQAQIRALLDFHASWFTEAADRLSKAARLEAAAAVLTRGLESAWKLERHLPHWRAALEALQARGERVDFHRPEWDWDAWSAQVEEMSAEIQLALTRSIPGLAELERSDETPDYLGQAVHLSAEACTEALRVDDVERFKPLFAAYFYGALLVTERVREAVQGQHPEQAVTWMTQPVLDAVDLSGYALIYSELHQNPELWEACREIWDRYLSGADGAERLQTIATWIAFENRRLGFSPRGMVRQGWERGLSQALAELPRGAPRGGRFFAPGRVEHPSSLIRHIAPNDDMIGMLRGEATEVFVALYLAKLDAAAELDFGLRDGLAEELQEAFVGKDEAGDGRGAGAHGDAEDEPGANDRGDEGETGEERGGEE